MWILPTNHPLYSHYAPECVASKEALNALSGSLERSLMWRSKPSSFTTWYRRWNRVYWLRHLFSQMLDSSRIGDAAFFRYRDHRSRSFCQPILPHVVTNLVGPSAADAFHVLIQVLFYIHRTLCIQVPQQSIAYIAHGVQYLFPYFRFFYPGVSHAGKLRRVKQVKGL